MKKNLVSAAVFAVIFAVTAACGTHTHDFSGDWHYDDTQHWKECPEDNAKGQTANHTLENGVCVCGYPKKCECTDEQKKNHYLPCTCEVEAPNVCGCQQVPRGYFGSVPVYQTIGVSEDNAILMATRIGDAYKELNTKAKTYVDDGNITSVEIVSSGDEFAIDSGVLKIKTGTLKSRIMGKLEDFVAELEELGLKSQSANNIIRLTRVIPQYNRCNGVRNRFCLVPLGVMVHQI